jgi:hypothetical protein
MTGIDKGQEWAQEKARLIAWGIAETQERFEVELAIAAALTEARAEERRAIADRLRDPNEAMVEAAVCGWNNVSAGFDFSPYQRSAETRESWKRVFRAIADVLSAPPLRRGSRMGTWLYSTTPQSTGWYPVLRCWDPEEGWFPDGGYWTGTMWDSAAVAAWIDQRQDSEAAAKRIAYEKDPDAPPATERE